MVFESTLRDKKILVTGHTGFKGSWLIVWLHAIGAKIGGFSLPTPPTTPSNYTLCQLDRLVTTYEGDISDFAQIRQCIAEFEPDIIFHMAAQPLVLPSLEDPITTYHHNTMGTVNLLEAVRQIGGTQAIIAITTDKVYANREWVWGYRETDPLGGKDPYSASKAMAELAIDSYRHAFFRPEWIEQHGVTLASVRAGNVIGGGDFADFRLVPDCMTALMAEEPIVIRNPYYIRPWQHVLVPLSGYLLLAHHIMSGTQDLGEAWNFGPLEIEGITTGQIADKLIDLWGSGSWITENSDKFKRETGRLRLSWEKAAERLAWRPAYDWVDALEEIVDWTRAYQRGDDMFEVCQTHLSKFIKRYESLKF